MFYNIFWVNKMLVKVKKLNDKAIIPTYGSLGAAGADLYAMTEGTVTIEPGATVLIGTGIAMEIPEGYVGLVFARSGLSTKQGLAPANKVGVIDSDYRGEIKVPLFNQSSQTRFVECGDRIAQIAIVPFLSAQFTECETLDDTNRGEGGFGSTGRK